MIQHANMYASPFSSLYVLQICPPMFASVKNLDCTFSNQGVYVSFDVEFLEILSGNVSG